MSQALVLRNSGTDCFIIGPVNLVHSVAPLRDAILEIAPILEGLCARALLVQPNCIKKTLSEFFILKQPVQ